MVHDALDYDRAAVSIAQGEGWPHSRAPGRETAFRPPAYPVLLAGVYTVAGVTDAEASDRVLAARILGIVISSLIVVLIGVVAAQLWGRRVALAAMALGAVYVPLIAVGGAVMSETLFAALMLGALAAVIQHRRSTHRWRWVLLAGVLGGLTILTRANALVLLLPLGLAVWTTRPRFSPRALAAPAVLVVLALLTVSPWTIRNAVVFDRFIPGRPSSARRWRAPTTTRRAWTRRTRPRGARSATSPPTASCTRGSRRPPSPRSRTSSPRCRRPTSASTRPTSPRSRSGPRCARSSSPAATGRATPPRRSASPGLGRRGRVLLLDLRPARAGRRDDEGGPPHAAVGLARPAAALPEHGLPRRRDPPLPHGYRPVHRDARRAGGHVATTNTSSVRGPCTPSTRSSSISDVADGPDTSVIGRPSAAAAASAATASGTDATT